MQADQGVRIAGLKAEAAVKEAEGSSQATRLVGLARAEAYKVGAEAIGPQSFSALQLMKVAGRQKVRIVPDVSVTGANGTSGLADALLGMVMKKS